MDRAKLVRIVPAGESFGDLALFNDEPRMATCLTRAPTECAVLHKRDFLDIFQRE